MAAVDLDGEEPDILDEAQDGYSAITKPEYTPLTSSDWDPDNYP